MAWCGVASCSVIGVVWCRLVSCNVVQCGVV